ncbi:MAG: dihydrolipoamide acetyltransferase family protein [Rhodothalassiaceae bacterium]
MARPFKLQDPGEGIHEVEVLEVLVDPGQTVSDGDTAFVVESDKAAIELPAPYDGTVAEILVKVGDTVTVGDTLMTIETGEQDAEAAAPAPQQHRAPTPKADTPEAPPASAPPPQRPDGPIKAAPAARKLAKERGIDLGEVTPSGRQGHITKQDVLGYAEASSGAPAADLSGGAVTIEPLRSIRRATAKQMARAWAEIPHVMLQEQFDLTDLERLRRQHAPAVKAQGGQLTHTVFVLKALAATLREHPRFNASIDMAKEEIHLKPDIHIGVALDSARGLIVPVLRHVDHKSVFQIGKELKDLAERVRGGRADPADLKGATISLTNIGALGGRGFFPIINAPEVAILGLGRGGLEPVMVSDLDAEPEIEVRYRMPVSLSFDHRVNDGADAARFLAALGAKLADPAWFVLHG